MLSFLLLISFALHIVTFYILLIQRKNPGADSTGSGLTKNEIEKLLDKHLNDIEEKNRALLRELKKKNSPHEVKDTGSHLREAPAPFSKPDKPRAPEPKGWEPPLDHVNDQVDQSINARVLNYRKQGMSVTEIAKKTGKGKGEIDLLLKYHEMKRI